MSIGESSLDRAKCSIKEIGKNQLLTMVLTTEIEKDNVIIAADDGQIGERTKKMLSKTRYVVGTILK